MHDVFVELKNITKYFPGVVALRDVTFSAKRGMVHGLVGENGAGKSTLIKILTGVHQPDKGEIFVNGKKVKIGGPSDSKNLGIGCVYQELNLCPDLSITDNLFLNAYEEKGLFLNYKEMHERSERIMADLGQRIDPRTKCGELGLGVQQAVEIGKSVLTNSRLLIMDEPTSSLSEAEVSQLYSVIKRLKKQGVSIIFISHKLEEVYQCCDDVTVMRDGQLICTKPVSAVTKEQLVSYMVGRSLDTMYPKSVTKKRNIMLSVKNLSSPGILFDVNFEAYGGQVLGFFGLVGAGRTETMRAIFGVDNNKTGDIYIGNNKTTINSPRDAISNNIAFLTEDRKKEGLILGASVVDNLSLVTIDRDKKGLFLDKAAIHKRSKKNVETFRIKTSSLNAPVGTLSGGNQQKVVIAKWVNTNADIYIFDEPTRGIDIGAKTEVYNVINDLVKEGKCVVIVSSELPEIIGISDRVIVMRHGRIMADIDRQSSHFNQEDIMKAAWGGKIQ
ncbi:MAG: sugar ABC transporter ATP-binding protein [Clostridiaceae bacterium]|jgi:ribose transport system ATP-binding protein|nr:sugar ABC transporter ATP-binding protein [Clostridiaceae bacterium]